MSLFWDTDIKTRKRVTRIPPFPHTGWKAPKEFPRLSNASVIGLDTETYDPGLKLRGPGWARKEGHIVGVSIAADTDGKWYFPIRHEVCVSENLNPKKVIAWLKDVLSTSQPKVGANLIYDLGWLEEEDIIVNGELFDVQNAEALLVENEKVGLDYLGERYLGEGKETQKLYQWLSERYGGKPTSDQRANIYRAPPSLVGPYAEQDADLPIQIIPFQAKKLKKENLWNLFRRENKLIRLLIRMRQHGVRVDVDKAEQVSEKLNIELINEQKALDWLCKQKVNVNANASIQSAFDSLGVGYPYTPSGNPSFTKDFLKSCRHPIGQKIIDIRKLSKLKNDFVDKAILDHNVNGRIHCVFHQLKSDSNGARSGRLSATDPNLQQVPSRDKKLAPLVRGCFVPDYGHKQFKRQDASQVEYRFLVNYAVGKSGKLIRSAYNKNPFTDYHKLTQDLVKNETGIFLDRKPIKNINFGIVYGMQVYKLSRQLNIPLDEAEHLLNAYHEGAPFVKDTMDYCSNFASQTGYITTILGRRSRFNLWEPADYSGPKDSKPPALPYKAALKNYGGNITRAWVYRALNRRLQGSSADLMKESMLQCDEAGYFDEIGVPLLTIHDELGFSDPGGKDKIFKEIMTTCENAIKIKIPIIIEEETGPDWGHTKLTKACKLRKENYNK